MQNKFCKDCKYYYQLNSNAISFCKSPNNGFDLVTGELKFRYTSSNRGFERHCGAEAKWFESKPGLFGFIKKLIG